MSQLSPATTGPVSTDLLGPPIDLQAVRAQPAEVLVMRYRQGIAHLDGRAFELEDLLADMAFLPDAGVGRWPVRVLMGHLADAEALFRWRMMRVLAERHPTLELWDEDSFIDGGLYGGGVAIGEGEEAIRPPVGAYAAMIYTTRAATAAMLVQLPESAWARTGLHPERGVLTLHDLLASAVWHLEHHARFLNAKVFRMLGPAPAADACCGGGACGSAGCACQADGSAGEHATGRGCGDPSCGCGH